ncbi:MAG: hypothetical protein IPH51_08795 [Rubrivivax sp.]|nr:hypothetical protein [Rubrivivax sp.]
MLIAVAMLQALGVRVGRAMDGREAIDEIEQAVFRRHALRRRADGPADAGDERLEATRALRTQRRAERAITTAHAAALVSERGAGTWPTA